MTRAPRPAGAVRWWTPLLVLAGGTAALLFAAWVGGVDMAAAGQRLHDRLQNTFHSSSIEWNDRRGSLRIDFDADDNVTRATFDGRPLPLEDLLIEDDYLTVTSLRYEDGELKYWRIPLSWEGDLREEVCNPRWSRTLMRVHPRPKGEPPGLRVARLDDDAAAAQAGVLVGDVIVGVEGRYPASSPELEALLSRALADRAPGGTLALNMERADAPTAVLVELEPLVSREKWESLDIEDPVERYLVLNHPRRRREYEREQDRSASVQEDPQPGELAAPPEAPGAPPVPPALPEGDGP